MLRKELPGYPEYARHVRYQLVPGVWWKPGSVTMDTR